MLGDRRAQITVSGNFQMFNTNTLQLASELEGRTLRVQVPDTVTTPKRRAADLEPRVDDDGQALERILVVALHDEILFTPDARVRSLYREAKAAGWREVHRAAIPVGGTVVVLRHR